MNSISPKSFVFDGLSDMVIEQGDNLLLMVDFGSG